MTLNSPDAQVCPQSARRRGVPRAQPGGGSPHGVPQGRGLRRVRADPRSGVVGGAGAAAGLLPDAQPLAPAAVAPGGWGPGPVHAAAVDRPRPPLAGPLPRGGAGAPVPGPLQKLSSARGCALPDRRPVRGAQPAAGEAGGAGGGLALVQPLASRAGICAQERGLLSEWPLARRTGWAL